jgi:hypothetical protein
LRSKGGMKAVMWYDSLKLFQKLFKLFRYFSHRTDAFQIIIMFIGLLSALIKGLIDVGGFKNVIDINAKYGRIDFFV